MSGGSWLSLVTQCLDELERGMAGSTAPVVDHEVIASAPGSAEDLTIWLVCRTREERDRFVDGERTHFVSQLKQRLLARGFPEEGVISLTVRVTSRPALAAVNGQFAGLR